MSEEYREIREAIDNFETERARDLIREALKENPTAEVYYLASQVAMNDYQRRKFLSQALELDPFHTKAERALESLNGGAGESPSRSQAQSTFGSGSSGIPGTPYAEKAKRDYTASANVGGQTSYALADFGTRLLALIIDIVILSIVGFVVGTVIGIFMPTNTTEEIVRAQNFSSAVGILINIAYYAYFLTQNDGQTPGKSAMNIKIVKKNGEPLTVMDAFLRNVVGYLISSIVFLLGFFWMLFDPESQTWHDKISNTVVVRV